MKNPRPKRKLANKMLSPAEKLKGISLFNGLAWRERWFNRRKRVENRQRATHLRAEGRKVRLQINADLKVNV